ncbi:hypothetical protein [Streptomyces albireticuli]|nr:hypothetical protein [Streptomyces albireticuli]MCD9146145.1 hypothetical protein [Streptomyces albireticuli]MCD9166170.1 hypothetical protein [Streptomyces albireticuli]MCD9196474.1 hypothetical protein [Streptomyces albireticuli]
MPLQDVRRALREAQVAARPYLLGLAELAGLIEPERFIGPPPAGTR